MAASAANTPASGVDEWLTEDGFAVPPKHHKTPETAAARRDEQQAEEGHDDNFVSEVSRSNAGIPVDHSDGSPGEYHTDTDNRDDGDVDTPWVPQQKHRVLSLRSWVIKRQKMPLEVRVSWLNFEHFKNRYSPTDGLAIIEVLRGHRDLPQEVTAEETSRKHHDRAPFRVVGPNTPPADGHDWWIQRVRIQSPELLHLLARLTGNQSETDGPRVFFPPFRVFYYYLPQVRECLGILERKWAETPPAVPDFTAEPTHPKQASDPDIDQSSDDDGYSFIEDAASSGTMEPAAALFGTLNSPKTLSHVREYIRFVDRHIVPTWNDAAGITKRKVRFNDLWMSFKPGELLYVPSESEYFGNLGDASEFPKVAAAGKRTCSSKVRHSAYRLYSMVLGGAFHSRRPDDIIPQWEDGSAEGRWLDLRCYYIDFDGVSYVPVGTTIRMGAYQGERDITSF